MNLGTNFQLLQVSLEKAMAIVHYNPELQTPHRIATAISGLGFETRVTTIKKPPTGRTRTSSQVRPKPRRHTGRLAHTVLHVEGMVCTSCVDNIESNIGELEGVSEIRVSLQEKQARVSYNPKITNPEKLCEAIEDIGFDATQTESNSRQSITESVSTPTVSHVDIKVEGMVCQSCVDNIEENLSTKKGVKTIKVSLKDKLASVTYDPKITNPRRVADAIDDMGFEAAPLISEEVLQGLMASPSTGVTILVGVDGMTCHSCVSLIESGLDEIDGVNSAKVSLERKEATIIYDSSKASAEDFKTAIEDMGFIVTTIKCK